MLFKYRKSVDAIQVSENPNEIVEFVRTHQIPAETNGPNSWVLRVPGHNQVAARTDWIIAAPRGNTRNVQVMDDAAFQATFEQEESFPSPAEKLQRMFPDHDTALIEKFVTDPDLLHGAFLDINDLVDFLADRGAYLGYEPKAGETAAEAAIRLLRQQDAAQGNQKKVSEPVPGQTNQLSESEK